MIDLFKKPLWTLHNPLKAWTLQGLSFEEASLIVSTLTTAEVNLSVAWRSDWKAWQKMTASACQELFQTREPRGAKPPAIPNALLSDDDGDVTQVRPSASLRQKVARKFDRYKVEVPCEVIVGEHVFKTKSQDISGGGFCFEDSLPEWVAGYFTVVVKTPGELEFTCGMVEDQKQNRRRVEILDMSKPETIEALQTWLETSGFPKI